MSEPIFKMIDDNLDPETVTAKVLAIVNSWFEAESITQNDVQKEMMASHVKAMVHRAKTLEPLPEVDVSLFDEISEASLHLAKKTVGLFNTLPVEEAYLLSVHFEVAREN